MPRPDDAARAQMLKGKIDDTYGDEDGDEMPPMEEDAGPPPGGGGMMPPPMDGEGPPQGGGDMVMVPRELVNMFMQQAGMDSIPVPRQMVDAAMQHVAQKSGGNPTQGPAGPPQGGPDPDSAPLDIEALMGGGQR